ncbi:MAG: hypothetical protein K6T66_06700 [Peptococcaceae bacterium]|nr:hypothetical protein [Peptococcaceae bacterium]
MFREVKRTVICQFLGRAVEISEFYQVEGTGTCQVEVNPLHWHCRESGGCGVRTCDLQREYYLLKQNPRSE